MTMKSEILSKKKICFILPKFAPESIGGAELQIFYLIEELIKRGYAISYIRHKPKSSEDAKEYKGITLYAIPNIKYFFLQFLNVFYLLSAMRNANADMYYSRVSKSYLPIVVWGARKLKARSVWACSHDREVEIFLPRTKQWIKNILEYFEHWIFCWGLQRVDQRFVQSEIQHKLLLENYSLNSIKLENSHPLPELKQDKRENYLVWIANFREFKQPELYMELARSMSKIGYKFLMIGEIFSVEMKEKINQLSNETENFEYLGSKTIEEINSLLWKCKLLVNTSTHEGFPNTFIQALMRGVPIISFNVDPGKIISSHELGIVNNNIDILKNKIDKFMTDKSYWIKTSNDCRDFAEKRFSIEKYTDILLTKTGFTLD